MNFHKDEGDMIESRLPFKIFSTLHTIEFCILGTLAPSLKPSKLNDTIDLIFATHWIYPSQTPVLQADDEKCVNDELSKRSGKYINLYIYCP